MKNLTTAVALLLGSLSFAQTAQNKFVEVHVNDTIWVKIQSFDYQVTISDADYYPYDDYIYSDSVVTADYPRYEKEQQEKFKKEREKRMKELYKLLTKNKFEPRELKNIPPYITPDSDAPVGYAVAVKNPAEVKRLQETLKQVDYASASAGNIHFGILDIHESRFMKKLMDHARKKAQAVADASGQKLGQVLEVYEVDTYNITVSDFSYENYNNIPTQEMMRIWPKTLTVKFELE
jgi:hypothetical protein